MAISALAGKDAECNQFYFDADQHQLLCFPSFEAPSGIDTESPLGLCHGSIGGGSTEGSAAAGGAGLLAAGSVLGVLLSWEAKDCNGAWRGRTHALQSVVCICREMCLPFDLVAIKELSAMQGGG